LFFRHLGGFLRDEEQQLCHKLTAEITSTWCAEIRQQALKITESTKFCPVMLGEHAEARDKMEQGWQVLAILSITIEVNGIGLRQAVTVKL
jgi:hypothetical protein